MLCGATGSHPDERSLYGMDRDGRDEGQEAVPTSSDTPSGANSNGTEAKGKS